MDLAINRLSNQINQINQKIKNIGNTNGSDVLINNLWTNNLTITDSITLLNNINFDTNITYTGQSITYDNGFVSNGFTAFHKPCTFFDKLFVGDYIPDSDFQCHIKGSMFVEGELTVNRLNVNQIYEQMIIEKDEFCLNNYKIKVSQKAFHFLEDEHLAYINTAGAHGNYFAASHFIETPIIKANDTLKIEPSTVFEKDVIINQNLIIKGKISNIISKSICAGKTETNKLVINEDCFANKIVSKSGYVSDFQAKKIVCEEIECNTIKLKNHIKGLNADYLGNKKPPKSEIVGLTDMQVLKNKSFATDIDLNGNRIKNVGKPTSNGDLVTKEYVDNLLIHNITYTPAVKCISDHLDNFDYFRNETYQLVSRNDEKLIIDGHHVKKGDLIILRNIGKFNGFYSVVDEGGDKPWQLKEENEFINLDVTTCTHVENGLVNGGLIVKQVIKENVEFINFSKQQRIKYDPDHFYIDEFNVLHIRGR